MSYDYWNNQYNQRRNKRLGINTNDNLIMFYYYYESYEDIDKMISMTVDRYIMNNQIY